VCAEIFLAILSAWACHIILSHLILHVCVDSFGFLTRKLQHASGRSVDRASTLLILTSNAERNKSAETTQKSIKIVVCLDDKSESLYQQVKLFSLPDDTESWGKQNASEVASPAQWRT